MEKQELFDKLTELTEGLLYISESEGEFSVYEVDAEDEANINGLMQDIASQPSAAFREEDAELFFERVIASLDTADETMAAYRDRYIQLFSFLRSAFDKIRVSQAGDIYLDVFIVCSSSSSGAYLLHTTAVET